MEKKRGKLSTGKEGGDSGKVRAIGKDRFPRDHLGRLPRGRGEILDFTLSFLLPTIISSHNLFLHDILLHLVLLVLSEIRLLSISLLWMRSTPDSDIEKLRGVNGEAEAFLSRLIGEEKEEGDQPQNDRGAVDVVGAPPA